MFNGGSRSMEIDISFSFTKILCMKMHCHIFLGGVGKIFRPRILYIVCFSRGWAVHLVSLPP